MSAPRPYSVGRTSWIAGMAFVPGFKHDVFVSYAHADDGPEPAGPGWVAQFVTFLKASLRSRLGGADDLDVFLDATHLQANYALGELLAAARGSAVFVAVASRSYAEREWTRRELEAFVGAAGDARRLFSVEVLPLDGGQDYPPPLQGRKRMEFWYRDEPRSRTPMPLSPTHDAAKFTNRVGDLAEQIRGELKTLRAALASAKDVGATAERSSAGLGVAPAETRTVLLAQVTEDLAEEREDVRRHLEQFGVQVLPADDYPQGGEAFRAAVTADLARADLFVQLLSGVAGRAPPDLPEGYLRAQLALAEARGAAVMQWRHPDLDTGRLASAQQRALLGGVHVMAVGLEAFKAEVQQRLSKRSPAPKAPRSSLVFINADRDDLPIAKALQGEFSRNAFPVAVPSLSGAAEDVRADLEENLVDCDALVLVYGQASPVWVRGQLRLFNRVRRARRPEEPPRVLAIFTGPPSEKEDIGFDLPDARRIDCRDALDLTCLRGIMDALA